MSPRSRQRGAALIEFALALPFALTLFVGIGDFSVYFWRLTKMEEVARIATAKLITSPLLANAASLESLQQSLQAELRQDSGNRSLTISLELAYACPDASGGEISLSPQPRHCPGERHYLRLNGEDTADPMLLPLRSMGFPRTVFTRHAVRIR